jgi:Tol biopolymer transport system component
MYYSYPIRRNSMKKLVIILLIIIVLGVLAIPFFLRSRNINESEDDGKDVVQAGSIVNGNKGTILFARHGLEKGIYSISMKNGKKQCLTKGNIESAASGGGTTAFTDSIPSQTDGQCSLHCVSMDSGNAVQSFSLKGGLTEKTAVSPDGTMAVYILKNKKGNCELYSISTDDGKTDFLGITASSMTDVNFMDNKSIIYSKLVMSNNLPIYQLFTYSMKTEEEKRIHISGSNDINPVVSSDGKFVAFLSLVGSCYSPCIMELKAAMEGEDRVINKDVVLGGTLKWSPNSQYLLYTAVSYSSQDVYSIKVVDTKASCQSRVIGRGYIGDFSPDSTSVVFAAYNQQTGSKMQTLSITDVYGKSIRELISLTEYGCYAKSIRMLEWINN